MRNPITWISWWLGLGCLMSVQAQVGHIKESPEAYGIVTRTTLSILPTSLKPFFITHQDDLLLASGDIRSARTMGRADRDTRFSAYPESHYLALDASAGRDDPLLLSAAAHRFPRQQDMAKKLAGELGYRSVGTLPWAVVEGYEALTDSFRQANPDEILQASGKLIHFCADAVLPSHVLRKFVLESSVDSTDQSYLTVIHEQENRLLYETRVFPERYRRISDPLEAVFSVLLDTHAAGLSWLALDKKTQTVMVIKRSDNLPGDDQGDFSTYSRKLDLIESRLEAGALLAAGLMGRAWVNAGRPSLPIPTKQVTSDTTTTNNSAASKVKSQPTVGLMGSRHSTVFHRSTCSHAKRIKSTNIVRFGSQSEARQAGRKPCKTCKPNG